MYGVVAVVLHFFRERFGRFALEVAAVRDPADDRVRPLVGFEAIPRRRRHHVNPPKARWYRPLLDSCRRASSPLAAAKSRTASTSSRRRRRTGSSDFAISSEIGARPADVTQMLDADLGDVERPAAGKRTGRECGEHESDGAALRHQGRAQCRSPEATCGHVPKVHEDALDGQPLHLPKAAGRFAAVSANR